MKFAFACLVALAIGCAPVPKEKPDCSGGECCPTVVEDSNDLAGRYHYRGRSGQFFKRGRRFG